MVTVSRNHLIWTFGYVCLLLQHAHAHSSGFFITQDSSFGNLILPVLPRLEPESWPLVPLLLPDVRRSFETTYMNIRRICFLLLRWTGSCSSCCERSRGECEALIFTDWLLNVGKLKNIPRSHPGAENKQTFQKTHILSDFLTFVMDLY